MILCATKHPSKFMKRHVHYSLYTSTISSNYASYTIFNTACSSAIRTMSCNESPWLADPRSTLLFSNILVQDLNFMTDKGLCVESMLSHKTFRMETGIWSVLYICFDSN